MVSVYLCHPLPELKDTQRDSAPQPLRYDLERFVARLDHLHRKLRYELVK